MANHVSIMLVLAAATGALFFLSLPEKADWLPSMLNELSGGFLGSFLTVLLVDRVIRNREQAEQLRVQKVAMRHSKRAFVGHLTLLAQWHKASTPKPPSITPNSLRAFFCDNFYESLRFFDFNASAPTIHPTTWFNYSAHYIKEFQDTLERVEDKYATVLPVALLELITEIRNDSFMSMVRQAPPMVEADKALGVNRTYTILHDPSMIDLLRQHTELLVQLEGWFDQFSLPLDFHVNSVWQKNVAPDWGVSRNTPQPGEPNIKSGRGNPPE